MKKIFKILLSVFLLSSVAYAKLGVSKTNEFEKIVSEYKDKYKAKEVIVSIVDEKLGETLYLYNEDMAKNKRFEPRSTLRPILMAIILEENLIKEDEKIYIDKDGYKIQRCFVKDRIGESYLNYKQILKLHSNVGMVKLGERVSKYQYIYWFKALDINVSNVDFDWYKRGKVNVLKANYFLGFRFLTSFNDLMRIYAQLGDGHNSIFKDETIAKIQNILKEKVGNFNVYKYNNTLNLVENKRYVDKYIYTSFGVVKNDSKRYTIGVMMTNPQAEKNVSKSARSLFNELVKRLP